MLEKIYNIIKNDDNIVFFGGAGVSTESGIKDFRSKDGIYNETYKYNPETILSHSFFYSNRLEFYKFYFDKLVIDKSIQPNKAHKFLAYLESENKLKAVITQNIDGLHELAGSKNVINLHGTIHENYCDKCNKFYSLDYMINHKDNLICECGGFIKPNVVLYEEPLDEENINKAIKYISEANTLIIGGTSLTVYPAAGLIRFFKGKNLIVINKDNINTIEDAIFINEPIGEFMGKLEELYVKEKN